MEQLCVSRDIPVAGMHGMQRQAAPEKPKIAWPLQRCASCPCFGAGAPLQALQIPCQYLPKTQSAILHQDHYRHPLCLKTSQNVPNNCRPYYRSEPLMSSDKTKSSMLQHISNVCAPCCPCPPRCGPCCGPCCSALPAPCNTPPRCIQYMTGYYYYPYGFWFCGPYHVTGTCVPGGPVAPGGPCGPCAPNPGGPCGPCNPGCVCGVLNSLAVMPTFDNHSSMPINLMPSEQAMNMLDVTKLKLPFNMSSLPMSCLPLYASGKGGRRIANPLPGCLCGPCCGPCCGSCGPGCAPCCGGRGPCGPCGPQGPFGPCGPCFPGVGCGACGFGCCGPSSQCCVGPGCCCNGCCGGMCVGPCGPCGPYCGLCGPCGCGCGCGPCGPCGCGCGCGPCCGPCGPLTGPCGCGACGCGPCGCGACLPFGCGACCGVAPCPCPSSTGMCQPSPPPPTPSTTGQWSGPCVNCKCTRPIPVNEKTLGGPTGPVPFTQCCLALATDKVDVEELSVWPTCTSITASSEEEETSIPVPPKKAVNTMQPPNRPGSNLTVFHKHPGYNETKQLADRPKPLVNSILTCYQSTLSGITSLRAIKNVENDSMQPSVQYLKTQNDESFPTSDKPKSIPADVKPRFIPAYVKQRFIPTYDQPRYVPNDEERELPRFPNCFTHLNAHPRCASKANDLKDRTSPGSGIYGL